MIVMGLRAPSTFEEIILELEMQLARCVQSDLLPKAASVSSYIDFAAAALSRPIMWVVISTISLKPTRARFPSCSAMFRGKGIPAALLASVVQGAIRSSTAVWHETACERINTMLCERSASGQYATLFWAVFDPISATLRYVNAGHGEPLLLRKTHGVIQKLSGADRCSGCFLEGDVLGKLSADRAG